MLKDAAKRWQAADKTEVEAALADAKKTLEGSPTTAQLKSANEKLTLASHKLAEAMYKASSPQAGPAPGPAAADAPPAGEQKKEGEVIDAEYVDVDEKK